MHLNLNFIIADDDAVYRELTLQQLALLPNLNCMAVCDSALAVHTALQSQEPDLLVLDVEMPGLSGIELAKSLRKLPMIIFISSHSKYAADAFDVDALDYLVKPVPQHRLMRAIEKARQLQEIKQNTPGNTGFKTDTDQSFFIKDKNSYIRIQFNEVLYIESLGDFVNIFLVNGEKKIALVNLKSLEQQLPAELFIRISRTYMVQKEKITAIDSGNVSLGKIVLPMGKTYADAALQQVTGKNTIRRFF